MLRTLKHWLNGLPPWLLMALPGIVVFVTGTITIHSQSHYGYEIRQHAGDDWEYYRAAIGMLHGQIPYRDFALEYPPLSVIQFLLPLLLTAGHPVGFVTYCELLPVVSAIEMFAFTLLLRDTAKIAQISSSTPLAWNLVFAVVLSPLLPWRYDLLPALLTLLALRALLQSRSAGAGAWLGLGVAAKLYPIVLLPIMAAYLLWGRSKRNGTGAAKFVVACLASSVLSALPFATMGGSKFWSFVHYHQHRGIEIESISAGGIFFAHYLTKLPVLVVFNYGANHLVTAPAATILRCLPWAAAFALGLTALRAAVQFRAEAADDASTRFQTLAQHLTAILLAFIVTNKVFSPQYLIWLIPFAVFLPVRPVAVLAFAALLTTAIFPCCFDYVVAGQPWALALLSTRNLVVVALLAALVAEGRGRRLAFPRLSCPLVQSRPIPGTTP